MLTGVHRQCLLQPTPQLGSVGEFGLASGLPGRLEHRPGGFGKTQHQEELVVIHSRLRTVGTALHLVSHFEF